MTNLKKEKIKVRKARGKKAKGRKKKGNTKDDGRRLEVFYKTFGGTATE